MKSQIRSSAFRVNRLRSREQPFTFILAKFPAGPSHTWNSEETLGGLGLSVGRHAEVQQLRRRPQAHLVRNDEELPRIGHR
ncbi:MAG TPA: hypothetical protein DEF45_02870 [Rhodopirellula sp.]|nr:hypothetical protein [Rhodopirellula sp.]